MAIFISHSVVDTESLGEAWGREAQAGWVIGLIGDLGAGKTQFVKGLARGLGVTEKVHSPTFTLVNEYTTGRLPLFHLDLYRLDTPEQIHSAGLEEFLEPKKGVTVVEWVERLVGEHSTFNIQHSTSNAGIRWRKVFIEVVNETERRISYEDFPE